MRKQTTIGREVGLWLFFIYLLAVIHLTFTPFQVWPAYLARNATLIPFVETIGMFQYERLTISLYNIFGNLVMLVPFGFFLALIFPRTRKLRTIVLYSFCLSFFIELLQWVWAIRVFDIDDIILNTIGGGLGFLLFLFAQRLFARRQCDAKASVQTSQKAPIKPVLVGALVFVVAVSINFGVSYYQQTLSERDIDTQAVENGELVETTYRVDDYYYILKKEENGNLRLELYNRFFASRYQLIASSTSVPSIENNHGFSDLLFSVSYPSLTGFGRATITKRAPYALFGRLLDGTSTVVAEYAGNSYQAIIRDGYFLLIIDREIPLEDVHEKIDVYAQTANGEKTRLYFSDNG
jgi:glycopeptide antibiotics resistance protein